MVIILTYGTGFIFHYILLCVLQATVVQVADIGGNGTKARGFTRTYVFHSSLLSFNFVAVVVSGLKKSGTRLQRLTRRKVTCYLQLSLSHLGFD
jgi:hypothetical protein